MASIKSVSAMAKASSSPSLSATPGLARGFTLVEVLVALLVLSIGLLGLAGLQMFGLQANSSAYYRTLVTEQARDLADSMRANPTAIATYVTAWGDSVADPGCTKDTGSCTPAEMAAHDLALWRQSIAEGLPEAQGRACADTAVNDGAVCDGGDVDGDGDADFYTITLQWQDKRNSWTYEFGFSL